MDWKCAAPNCARPALADSVWCAEHHAKVPADVLNQFRGTLGMIVPTRLTLWQRLWTVLTFTRPDLVGELLGPAPPRGAELPGLGERPTPAVGPGTIIQGSARQPAVGAVSPKPKGK